jgi:glycosyltransferase involved in cell wall biosynthesis
LKVVQALGWYFPESLGGTEIYVAALADRLAQAGCAVTIAAPRPGGLEPRGLERYEHGGHPVLRYPIPAHPTRAEARGEVAARGTALFHDWLRAERPDVVHLHTFVTGLGLAEAEAARAAGARVVVTTHASSLGFLCQRGTLLRFGNEPCDGVAAPAKCGACALEQRGLSRPWADALGALPPVVSRNLGRLPGRLGTALGMSGLISRNLERQHRLFAAIDRFVVLTAWARSAVAANGLPAGKLALNRLGHSLGNPRPKPGPAERPTGTPVRLGLLGRFEGVKGAEVLVRTVASLPRELPLALELRGPINGPADARAADRLRELAGGDPRIAVEPAVPPREVAAVLAGWDVLVCPSLCHEGGPTVAIEAHAVGTPVVGSRLGGLAEMIADGENGRLLPPGDANALAGALAAIAHDPAGTVDRWRERLPPARTMDEVADDTLALYHELGAP